MIFSSYVIFCICLILIINVSTAITSYHKNDTLEYFKIPGNNTVYDVTDLFQDLWPFDEEGRQENTELNSTLSNDDEEPNNSTDSATTPIIPVNDVLNGGLGTGIEIVHSVGGPPTHPHRPIFFINKNIPITIFQKLRPINLIPSLAEKFAKVSKLLTYPYHPNFGGIDFLNPSHILEKVRERAQFLFPNTNAAVYGFGQSGGHDYPFPYRSLTTSEDNKVKNRSKRQNDDLEQE